MIGKRKAFIYMCVTRGDKYPLVSDDGTISNLDPAEAAKMAGVTTVRDKNGNITYREKRPFNCIFCGGKKCMRDEPMVFLSNKKPRSLYIFNCRSKQFYARFFGRDLASVTSHWFALCRKGKYNICPLCGSSRFVVIKKTKLSEKAKLDTFECKACGYRLTGSILGKRD